jgi:hypothetical protein
MQHMLSMTYCTILIHLLMILLFFIDKVCPVFRKAYLDTFGGHTIHCTKLQMQTYEFVTNVLFNIFKPARVSAKFVYVNFSASPRERRSIVRQINALVYRWIGDWPRFLHLWDWWLRFYCETCNSKKYFEQNDQIS